MGALSSEWDGKHVGIFDLTGRCSQGGSTRGRMREIEQGQGGKAEVELEGRRLSMRAREGSRCSPVSAQTGIWCPHPRCWCPNLASWLAPSTCLLPACGLARPGTLTSVLHFSFGRLHPCAAMTMKNYDVGAFKAVFDLLQNHFPERCVAESLVQGVEWGGRCGEQVWGHAATASCVLRCMPGGMGCEGTGAGGLRRGGGEREVCVWGGCCRCVLGRPACPSKAVLGR